MNLPKQFTEYVNNFCKGRTVKAEKVKCKNCKGNTICDYHQLTPEKIARQAKYMNAEKIDDVFNKGKGSIGLTVAGRMLAVMKKIDPTLESVTFEFDTVDYNDPVKKAGDYNS
jgi:hypothetical protein